MDKEESRRNRTYELTLVTLIFGDLLGDVLYLQQQLDALDGRDGGLGDCRGHTTGQKILGERHGIRESRHRDGLVRARVCAVCMRWDTGNVKEKAREERLLVS